MNRFTPAISAGMGKDHPMANEVTAGGETDWRKVVATLTSEGFEPGTSSQGSIRIFYQKQMTHHLLPEMDRSWLCLTNCF